MEGLYIFQVSSRNRKGKEQEVPLRGRYGALFARTRTPHEIGKIIDPLVGIS